MEYAYNPNLALITIFLITLMVICFYPGYGNKVKKNGNFVLVFLLMVLISVFAFTEYDTYHYHTDFDTMIKHGEKEHVEDYYFWLTQVLPRNYYIWRFAIWGGACAVIIWSLKLLKLNATITGAMIPLVLIARFNVSRASFGMAVLLFSIVLLVLPKKNIYIRILGLLGVFLSCFLHASMIVFVVIALLFLILPINKQTVVIMTFLFPLLYASVLVYSENILDTFGLAEENRIFSYLEADKLEISTIGLIYKIFAKVPLILMLFSISRYYLNSQKAKQGANIVFFKFYKIAFGFVYIAMLFFMQEVSDWVSTRTLDAGLFFVLIALIHYFETNNKTIIDKVYLFLWMFMLYFGQLFFIYDITRLPG